MMFSMLAPLPPFVLIIRMKWCMPEDVASLMDETTKSCAPGSMTESRDAT